MLVAYAPELLTVGGHVARVLSTVPAHVSVLLMIERVLATVGDTRTTQGILAAFTLPDHASQPVAVGDGLRLVLDRLRDPGNVGTLLRSAAAAGADMVLLSPGCADPYSPKVVRASAGAVFTVPFKVFSWMDLTRMLSLTVRVYATCAEAEVPYYEADLTNPCAILI
ncbi:MAG: RNA methyltransferase, partial [Chloroflexota bacterium]|nr:RNA methyltransferase [Chloroflexota bacterium]